MSFQAYTQFDMETKDFSFYHGVIDSTLREGRQFRFANFTLSDQVLILKALAQIGVDRAEVGNPVAEPISSEIRTLVLERSRPPLLAHVRNRAEDLKAALASGVEGVNILCNIHPERLELMKLTLAEYLDSLRRHILMVKEARKEVRVSVEDYFRSPHEEAWQVFALANKMRADRIGIADTLGIAMPWQVEQQIGELRRKFSIDIEVHFHNDLGQAVSNSLSAVRSGANWVDTTFLGIGERLGITALSTFLVSLYQLSFEHCQRYHLEHLTEAENLVARMVGKEVPINLPTNKENSFSHKAGIHLHALINLGPSTYEPYPPEMIGNERHLVLNSPVSGKTRKEDLLTFQNKFGGWK